MHIKSASIFLLNFLNIVFDLFDLIISCFDLFRQINLCSALAAKSAKYPTGKGRSLRMNQSASEECRVSHRSTKKVGTFISVKLVD